MKGNAVKIVSASGMMAAAIVLMIVAAYEMRTESAAETRQRTHETVSHIRNDGAGADLAKASTRQAKQDRQTMAVLYLFLAFGFFVGSVCLIAFGMQKRRRIRRKREEDFPIY